MQLPVAAGFMLAIGLEKLHVSVKASIFLDPPTNYSLFRPDNPLFRALGPNQWYLEGPDS